MAKGMKAPADVDAELHPRGVLFLRVHAGAGTTEKGEPFELFLINGVVPCVQIRGRIVSFDWESMVRAADKMVPTAEEESRG